MLIKARFSMFVWFLAAMTFAAAIGIPKGFNVATLLIFLCSLGMSFLKPVNYALEREDRIVIWVFAIFGVTLIAAALADQFQARGLDKPSRFLLAIPVLFLLLRAKGPKEWLWYGIVVGSILAFALALYERLVLGLERASGKEHPIMFGDTGMMLGLLSLVAAVYFYSQKRSLLLCFAVIGGLCGMGASVLSGSRGGWVAVPLVGFFLLWECRDLLGRKLLAGVVSVAAICIFVAIAVPQTGIQKRAGEAISNIQQYSDGSRTNTSVGARFDMWKAAIYMFEQSPILGVGSSQVLPIKHQLAVEGKVSYESASYGHSHNEYLDALSKRGLVGLAFLLVVYLVPLRLFLKKMDQYKENWNIKSYAMAGALIPMCYMDFGLSQVMFAHNIGVMMFAFPIMYFWAAVRWAERDELSNSFSK